MARTKKQTHEAQKRLIAQVRKAKAELALWPASWRRALGLEEK